MKKNLKIFLIGITAVAAAVAIAAALIGDSAQVIIDPGHGGTDIGAEYDGRYEKDDNLAVALLVNEKLQDMGVDSRLTRDEDKFISLEKRCKIANRKNAQAFVSLHRNSAENAEGVEIWISSNEPKADLALAESIMQALDGAGISQNRGVKAGYARGDGKDYYVNSHTDMPSCLVELGFMNSETDNELFDSKLDAYAEAIARAIAESVTK